MVEARDSYRELFERSADAILILEGETFIECNGATVELFRFASRDDVLAAHPSEISPRTQPDGRASREKASEMIAIAVREGSHRFEWMHQRADGEVFPAEVLLTPIMLEGRQVVHSVVRDITERRQLEEKLRQAQKMEAVGKLAGGIAHDFNNLLVVILGHADLLSETLSDPEEAAEHVHAIQEAGQRAANLVRQLLAFGRKQQRLPEVVDLNHLVDGMRRLLERLIGEDIHLVTDLADQALHVKVDPGQIEQVIMNLASNARDASPEGGTLLIRTWRDRAPDDASVNGNGDALDAMADSVAGRGAPDAEADRSADGTDAGPPTDWAYFSVEDSGAGMSPETVAKAFDPFFTTKEQGRGTGLGLATVYSIVAESGGTVRIDSQEGHGTTVVVALPITGEKPTAPHPKVHVEAPGGRERVLVVEDEPGVRKLIERTLARRGYDVVSAADGRQGREVYLRQGGRFDLIVTDVIMPHLSGPAMVRALRDEGYAPRTLYLSGYTDDQLSSLHAMGEVIDFLEKPFSPAVLASRVREALEGRASEK